MRIITGHKGDTYLDVLVHRGVDEVLGSAMWNLHIRCKSGRIADGSPRVLQR